MGFDTIMLLAATIQGMKLADEENHETLRTKLTRHASQLLKKPMKIRAMMQCIHLFIDTPHTGDVKEIVLKIFKRADKYAGQCMEEMDTVDLYLQIIQKQIYILENKKDLDIISPEIITAQVEKTTEMLKDMAKDENIDRMGELKSFYSNTKKYCKGKDLDVGFE